MPTNSTTFGTAVIKKSPTSLMFPNREICYACAGFIFLSLSFSIMWFILRWEGTKIVYSFINVATAHIYMTTLFSLLLEDTKKSLPLLNFSPFWHLKNVFGVSFALKTIEYLGIDINIIWLTEFWKMSIEHMEIPDLKHIAFYTIKYICVCECVIVFFFLGVVRLYDLPKMYLWTNSKLFFETFQLDFCSNTNFKRVKESSLLNPLSHYI